MHASRSSSALDAFPAPGRPLLRALLDAEFRGMIDAEHAQTLAHQTELGLDQLLVALLPIAATRALAPISEFHVGAVARGATTGNVYFGANLEFASQPLGFTVHAEQSTVNNAWLNGEDGVAELAVTAGPCGHCRQFLYELRDASALRILLPGSESGQVRVSRLADLMPLAFGPADLGLEGRLMARTQHALRLDDDSDTVLERRALDAANTSYAPYTGAYAGAAVHTQHDRVYAGRYAETAAFNPSLSPMASALALWSVADPRNDPIDSAVVVELCPGLNQAPAARSMLSSIAPGAHFHVAHASQA